MSAILKREAVSPERIRSFPWLDAREEMARLLDQARSQAAAIVAEARAEAGRLAAEAQAQRNAARAAAEAEGRAAGAQVGENEARAAFHQRLEAELAQARAAVDAIVAALKDAPARFAERAEAQTVGLALTVAEAVVKREVRTDPALVAGNVRAALEAIAAQGKVTLKLNPEDLVLLEGRLPEVLKGLAAVDRVEVVADAAVQRGGCTASGPGSAADATIEGQLGEIRKALLGEEGA